MQASCPHTEIWDRLAEGTLTEVELDTVWLHVDECPTCREIAAGLLHAAAWEALPGAVSTEALSRFRNALLSQVRQQVPKPSLADKLRSVILHFSGSATPPVAEPALVGDGETDGRTLQAELPSFSSSDESVLIRLRRQSETGLLLAYVIADTPELASWCSVIMEPGDREFVTDEHGICALDDITEAELPTSSFRLRPPAARFAPRDDSVTIDAGWRSERGHVLELVARQALSPATEGHGTAALYFAVSSDGQSAEVSVVLSDDVLTLLRPLARRSFGLVSPQGSVVCAIPDPASGSLALGTVPLPFSPLEARLFGD